MTVTGYTFRADIYCPSCALRVFLAGEGLEGHGLSYIVEEAFDLLARFRGIDRQDESSFDSGDFPKVILSLDDDDEVCGRCGQLIGTQSTSVPASVDAPPAESFVVIGNTPGYLSNDDDPPVFDNYDDAVAYLNDEADRYADDADANYRVEYGIASGDNLAAVIIHDDDKLHDLGYVIQILREEVDAS